MTIIAETYFGEPLTFRLITPGNTVTYFDDVATLAGRKEFTTYIERKLAYTSGGAVVMKPGDRIAGHTSLATAIIVSRTITSGTDALTTAAGVLTLKCQVGTFQSEHIHVEGNDDVATVATDSKVDPDDYPNKGRSCKAVLVHVVTNAILINSGSVLPGQTSLNGIYLAAGNSTVLHDPNEIRNLCCVDAVSQSAGSIRMLGYF